MLVGAIALASFAGLKYQTHNASPVEIKYGMHASIEDQDIEKIAENIRQNDDGYFLGDAAASRVVIMAQGGPIPDLDQYFIFGRLAAKFDTLDTLFVSPHQFQTKYPEKFSTRHITFEEAKVYTRESVEMVHKLVKQYQSEGKEIILSGSSYGTLVVQSYLQNYGSEDLTLAIVSAGRLDFQDEFWQLFSQGKFANFDLDQNIIPAQTAQEATMGGGTDDPYSDANMARLASGLGYVDYTQSLKDVDLTNFVYFFGTDDLQVGATLPHEIAFLLEKGATAYEVQGGNHGSTIDAWGDYIYDYLALARNEVQIFAAAGTIIDMKDRFFKFQAHDSDDAMRVNIESPDEYLQYKAGDTVILQYAKGFPYIQPEMFSIRALDPHNLHSLTGIIQEADADFIILQSEDGQFGVVNELSISLEEFSAGDKVTVEYVKDVKDVLISVILAE